MQYITNKKISVLQKILLIFVFFVVVIGGVAGPLNVQYAYALQQQDPARLSTFDALPACASLTSFSVTGCLAVITYYGFFYPLSATLAIVGEIFNITIAFSISSEVYNSEFVTEGWGIVRDMANITFIFILLYIAIATILQLGTINTNQALVNVIIIAFLVNFSLFFTQVVVDMGNITASYVYNLITAPAPTMVSTTESILTKNISVAFTAGFEPQKLLSEASFVGLNTDVKNMALVMVFLAGGIISVIAAYALGWAALILLVRIPVLWVIMIGAPFAFVAWILSGTQSFSKRWLHVLINQSFVAVIFLLFTYLIIRFIVNAKFLDDTFVINAATNSVTAVIIVILFKAAILIALLITAVKVARNMSKDVAGSAVNYATQGIGKAIRAPKTAFRAAKRTAQFAGATVGTFGFQGRRAHEKLQDKEFVADKSSTLLGRVQLKALEGIASGGPSGGYKGREETRMKQYTGVLEAVPIKEREAIALSWQKKGGAMARAAEKVEKAKGGREKIANAQTKVAERNTTLAEAIKRQRVLYMKQGLAGAELNAKLESDSKLEELRKDVNEARTSLVQLQEGQRKSERKAATQTKPQKP